MVTGLPATPLGHTLDNMAATLLPPVSPPVSPLADPCHPLPRCTVSYVPVSRIVGAAFTGGGGENTHSGQKPHGAWRTPSKNPRPYECHSSSAVLVVYTYTSVHTWQGLRVCKRIARTFQVYTGGILQDTSRSGRQLLDRGTSIFQRTV